MKKNKILAFVFLTLFLFGCKRSVTPVDNGENGNNNPPIVEHTHVAGEPVKENYINPSCTSYGEYDSVTYCLECGKEMSREHVHLDPLPHTPGEAVKENEQAATCLEGGHYDSVVYCTQCHQELSRETINVDATGHNYEKDPDTLEYVCTGCGDKNGRDYELYVDIPQIHVGDLYEPRNYEFSFKNDDNSLGFGYVVYQVGYKIIAKNNDSTPDYYFPEEFEGQNITGVVYVGVYDETNIKYVGESTLTNLDNVDVYVNKTLTTKQGYVGHTYWQNTIEPNFPTNKFYVYEFDLGKVLPAIKYHGETPVLSDDEKTLTYGLYPRSYVYDETLITELNSLSEVEENGWYLYNNEYYAKVVANPNKTNYTFNNGTTIEKDKTYWFKCEPIVWNVLSSKDGEYYLLSKDLIDSHNYFESIENERTIDGKTIYPSNYEHSDLRAWLNNEFYNKAFSLDSSYINTTTVDNSDAVTGSGDDTYASNNTEDKVFLPSYLDYLNPDYGFSSTNEPSETRISVTTEYARAVGAGYDIFASNLLYVGNYWTRSPFMKFAAYYFLKDGGYDVSNINWSDRCVRPAIKISL